MKARAPPQVAPTLRPRGRRSLTIHQVLAAASQQSCHWTDLDGAVIAAARSKAHQRRSGGCAPRSVCGSKALWEGGGAGPPVDQRGELDWANYRSRDPATPRPRPQHAPTPARAADPQKAAAGRKCIKLQQLFHHIPNLRRQAARGGGGGRSKEQHQITSNVSLTPTETQDWSSAKRAAPSG